MEKITKIDEHTIKVELTDTHEFKYDFDFLISQREILQEQKDKFLEQKDKELEKIDKLIKRCKELGVKSIIKGRNH